jgi:hypothetical protein
MKHLQWIAALAILALLVFVATNPQLAYAPVPRVVLFLLAAVFPALLIATTATTKLQLRAKGFLFVTSGASAFLVALLLLLNHIAKPELQVLMFSVVDDSGEKVNLSPYYAFTLEPNPSGLLVNHFLKGNAVVMIFPEQLVEQNISVKLAGDGKAYFGSVNYARKPTEPLKVGRELK